MDEEKIVKVGNCSVELPEKTKNNLIKVGTVIWVKGVVSKINPDGYMEFEGASPISGCIFGGSEESQNVYEDTEVIIED